MPEEKPDLNALRDKAVEFAKDLLMVDFQPLLSSLLIQDDWTQKQSKFLGLVAALKGASAASEDFRLAHIADKKRDLKAEMDAQFKDRLREIEAMTTSEEPKAVS